MAQMQNAQSVALQLEKVRDKLPLLYERDDILLTMIQQRGDVERVSSRNMRLPLQIRPGGKAGLANMDGGDLGRGSGNTNIASRSKLLTAHFCRSLPLLATGLFAPSNGRDANRERPLKRPSRNVRPAANARGTATPTICSTTPCPRSTASLSQPSRENRRFEASPPHPPATLYLRLTTAMPKQHPAESRPTNFDSIPNLSSSSRIINTHPVTHPIRII
jgi:hypothetical protein